MAYNEEKVDEVCLALMVLSHFTEKGLTKDEIIHKAWKGIPWEVTDRLHEKGFISDPKNKNKSVYFTDEGWKKAQEWFESCFGMGD